MKKVSFAEKPQSGDFNAKIKIYTKELEYNTEVILQLSHFYQRLWDIARDEILHSNTYLVKTCPKNSGPCKVKRYISILLFKEFSQGFLFSSDNFLGCKEQQMPPKLLPCSALSVYSRGQHGNTAEMVYQIIQDSSDFSH